MQKKNIWKRWIAAILMVIVCFSFVPSQLYGAEDYRSWDQGDSRWGDIPIGIEGDTMESSGCLVTSVTKLIIQAGLKNQEEINPGILATWLNENGGFTDSGALYWAKPAEYVDGLSYYGSLRDYDTYDSAEYE